jgi:CRISPR-associated protein Csd2
MPRPDALQRRHEFVLLFDVTNGNPNGDPDAGNMPRMDPETGHGLVSDVCLKRKIRNYVEIARNDAPQYRIYVTEGAVLNEKHREAYRAVRPDDAAVTKEKKLNPKSDEEAARLRDFMCANFFDIRSFGAVLSTGINAGQVRGPVQMGFARSVEPVLPLEMSITRMAATNEAEKKDRVEGEDDQEKRGDKRTMGRKHIIPYGLYRAHGYVSAPLAYDDRKGTGFSESDLALVFEALGSMFEHDRSAARGEMTTRRLVVFRHASALGNARAQALFDRVTVLRNHHGELRPIGATELDNLGPARQFADYAVQIDRDGLPDGIELLDLV